MELHIGKPRCGKSSTIVKKALEASKKGQPFYCNIQDLNIPGVRHFDVKDFGNWFEDYATVCIDEANLYFDNRDYKKNFTDEGKAYTRLFGHNKTKILFFTQTFDVDKKIRDMCDRIYLYNKFMNVFTVIRPVQKVLAIKQGSDSSDADSQVVDNLTLQPLFKLLPIPHPNFKITFIPKYAKYFDSYKIPENTKYMKYRESLEDGSLSEIRISKKRNDNTFTVPNEDKTDTKNDGSSPVTSTT